MRKGLLVFSCLSTLALGAWGEGKTYAVVIGVDNYLNPNVPKLRYAVADANIFAQALKQTLKLPDENLFLLTSNSPDDPNHPRAVNIANRLAWLNSHCKREDTIIFYFAGHGITMDKQPYLLTEESDNSNTLSLGVSSLPGAVLMDYLGKVKAANVWLVLDACRNNAGREPNSLGDVAFTRTDVGQDRTATMFSCKIGERSWESDEFQHGFYTYYLVAGLREKAVDDKGVIDMQGLSRFVSTQVPEAVSKLGQKQTPWLSYGGSDSWVLAKGLPPASGKAVAKADAAVAEYVAKLELKQAELDRETARRVAAEARAQALEGQRIELEQRLTALEKKLGLKAGQTASGQPAAPNVMAYADRSLGNADQSEAYKSEIDRLKLENRSLNDRLAKLESALPSGIASREAFVLKEEMVQTNEQFDAKQDVTSQFERYLEMGEKVLTTLEKDSAPVVSKQQMTPQDLAELAVIEKHLKVTREINKVLRPRRQEADQRYKTLSAQVVALNTRVKQLEAEVAGLKRDNKQLKQTNDNLEAEKRKLELEVADAASKQDEYEKWKANHSEERQLIRSGRDPWSYQSVQKIPYLLNIQVKEAEGFGPPPDKK
ncbi:caspase family protein [bacterium]|nr:caspase family protein [bacterium]